MMIFYGMTIFCVVTLVSMLFIKWMLPDASKRRVSELGEPAD